MEKCFGREGFVFHRHCFVHLWIPLCAHLQAEQLWPDETGRVKELEVLQRLRLTPSALCSDSPVRAARHGRLRSPSATRFAAYLHSAVSIIKGKQFSHAGHTASVWRWGPTGDVWGTGRADGAHKMGGNKAGLDMCFDHKDELFCWVNLRLKEFFFFKSTLSMTGSLFGIYCSCHCSSLCCHVMQSWNHTWMRLIYSLTRLV